jgi:low affinity Fe/Cu permease
MRQSAVYPTSRLGRALEDGSRRVTLWTGSSWAFAAAVLVIVLWLVTGPLFHFSDTWQLVINTGTTIVTFLMVFLIQRAQNKDSLAIQLKLNELVAAVTGASNRLIDVEDLSEAELDRLHHYYQRLAEMAKRDIDLLRSHSVEEAEARHHRKHPPTPPPPIGPGPTPPPIPGLTTPDSGPHRR